MSHRFTYPRGRASLLRQFAAIVYDAIAIAAVWFFATLIVVIARKGTAIEPGSLLFSAYLVVCAYLYFAFCWTRSGQTLGMKSWKIQLVSRHGEIPITVAQTALRFIGAFVSAAAFGLGYWWTFIDRDRLSWHDRLSRTRVVDATLSVA